VQDDPRDFDAADALAQAQFAVGDAPEALRTLAAALREEPDHEMLLGNAAFAALQARRPDLAARFLDRAAKISPGQIRYPVQQAQLALQQQRWTAAADASRRVLELDPSNFAATQWLVAALAFSGRSDEAEQALSRLQRAYPEQAATLTRWYQELQSNLSPDP
jgi:predicted Zn-dependent protease